MSRKRGNGAVKPEVSRQRPSRNALRGIEVTYIGRFPSDAEVRAMQDWFSCGVVVADGPEAVATVDAYRCAMIDFVKAHATGEINLTQQAMVVVALAAAVVAVSELKAAGRVRYASPEEAVPAYVEMLGRVQAAGLPLGLARRILRLLGVRCD